MKVAMLFLLIFMLIYVTKCENKNSTDFQIWEDFKIEYARRYGTPEEEQKRMDIFMENLREIQKHNKKFEKGKETYKLGVNGFADITSDEFMERYVDPSCSIPLKLRKPLRNISMPRIITGQDPEPPLYKNWVAEGAVTQVKNQDEPLPCGSCWAFATTGVIESHYFIKTGNLIELSEQNLIDCTGPAVVGQKVYPNNCNGGSEFFGLQYVVNNSGINTEQSYPYEAEQKQCRFNPQHIGAKIRDAFQITPRNELEMKKFVGFHGPITAAVRFEQSMRHIKKGYGIYSNPTCGKTKTSFAHAVLVVGYGVETVKGNNIPYWLIKNSWGPEWADDGYLKLRRLSNTCDIAAFNLYPLV